MTHRVNQAQLSEITGVTQVTLWKWQKEGMPYIKAEANGIANEYDTVDVIEWMIARAVAKGEKEIERDRLTRLQADKLQREMDKEDGLLVPVGQIEPAWLAIVVSVRQALLAQSARITPLLSTMAGDVDAIRQLLDEDAREMLTKLSHDDEHDSDTEPESPGPESVRAAAEDTAVVVGGTGAADAGGEPDPG